MPGVARKQINKLLSTSQGKSVSVAGLTVAIVVILIFFAIRPAYISITDKTTENQKKEDYLDEAESKIATLIQLNTNFEASSAAINLLNDFFLPETISEAFITKNVVNLAVTKDMVILNFSVDPPSGITNPDFPVTSDSVLESQFNLVAKGSLADLQSFVLNLERIPKITNIQSLNYSITENDGTGQNWQLTIKGFFYSWSSS